MAQEERQSEAEKRAEVLACRAADLIASGGGAKDAHRTLQEAAHLAPDNDLVRNTISKLQLEDEEQTLVKFCKRYILDQQEEAGKEAMKYLSSTEKASPDAAKICMHTLLNVEPTRRPGLFEGIFSGLLRHSASAKTAIAERLRERGVTIVFDEIYTIGEAGAAAMTTVVLSPGAWPREEERNACEEDLLHLYMAKLLEVGDDDDSRAMRELSRLLATDAPRLQALIDEEMFDAILSQLDYRNPVSTKSPAMLATAKFLEASQTRGQVMLTRYVTTRFAKQTNDGLVLAFSAAAAVFPIATPMAATMFLTREFLPSLVPLLEKKTKSKHVVVAALEMLSAACIESACRDGIRKHCLDWIQKCTTSDEQQRSVLAVVVLSKIQGTPEKKDGVATQSEKPMETGMLVEKLTKLLFEDPKANRDSVFEALAHQSTRPKVKEQLVNDRRLLQVLLQELRQAESQSTAVFGGLVILENVTALPPVLSEEQKRIAELKAYANAAPSSAKPDPLNEVTAVTARCKTLVDCGIVSTLGDMIKKLTPNSRHLVVKILSSMVRTSKPTKRIIIQQGAVKMLAALGSPLQEGSTVAVDQHKELQRQAGQAIAVLLTSVDPEMLFGPSGNGLLWACIDLLVPLLDLDSVDAVSGPRDLLPTFEALLALTNLCSNPTNGTVPIILKKSKTAVEDLTLSNNSMLRRASVELICNLVQDANGIAMYADGSPEASRRLHVLLALGGSPDLPTRKAATGALATLTEFWEVIDAINKLESGIRLLIATLDDEDEEVLHRSVVCILNVAIQENDHGKTARSSMRQQGVVEKLEMAGKRVRSPRSPVLPLLSEATQAFRLSSDG
ncbi:uncharacterized protein KY384_007870 [Bacidia gigantensis]|uniref:uncharacterized protein n=1 Tax=Bacidia gigantensis TaxID=2732470 RepID=UPI001D048CC4|nr:uncharacterized protein KY384_007870 [Bacidia gigantensis]KAG8527716.1 hypothetical protein KY384_007870 [Bacidia gigantensis]